MRFYSNAAWPTVHITSLTLADQTSNPQRRRLGPRHLIYHMNVGLVLLPEADENDCAECIEVNLLSDAVVPIRPSNDQALLAPH